MAETTGFVQELKWSVADAAVIALIGDDPSNCEAFTVVLDPADAHRIGCEVGSAVGVAPVEADFPKSRGAACVATSRVPPNCRRVSLIMTLLG